MRNRCANGSTSWIARNCLHGNIGMDTTAIIAIVSGAVLVLSIALWRFNVVNIRGKIGDKEASLEASQHPPATP